MHTVPAYGRDLVGIAALLAEAHGLDVAELGLSALTKPALSGRSPPGQPAMPGRLCCGPWSIWNRFFRWLVSEDLVEGNPMDGMGKRKPTRGPVKVIRGEAVVARLLATAPRSSPSRRSPARRFQR